MLLTNEHVCGRVNTSKGELYKRCSNELCNGLLTLADWKDEKGRSVITLTKGFNNRLKRPNKENE